MADDRWSDPDDGGDYCAQMEARQLELAFRIIDRLKARVAVLEEAIRYHGDDAPWAVEVLNAPKQTP